MQSLRPLAILPDSLSLSKNHLWLPPRTFYGFPLPLPDAVRFLEKKAHIDPISDATNVDAQLKAASLLPDLVDQYIQALFLLFDIKYERVQHTFFADVIDDGRVITLFAIGDSWNPISTPPPVIAGVADFLEKENIFPHFYLAAHEDGLWGQACDPRRKERLRQPRLGQIRMVLNKPASLPYKLKKHRMCIGMKPSCSDVLHSAATVSC